MEHVRTLSEKNRMKRRTGRMERVEHLSDYNLSKLPSLVRGDQEEGQHTSVHAASEIAEQQGKNTC